MSKYDGPSYFKNDHPKIESIQGKPKEKKLPKYELPDSVRTREELQKEADRYMETPSYMNRRFRSTQVPKSLSNLDGWKQKRRNDDLIEKIRQRLAKEDSDYLLFEEFLKEEVEPSETETVTEPIPEPFENPSNSVNLVREDLAKLNFNKKPAAINQEKAKKSSRKKVVRSTKKNVPEKLKPTTGLSRSLSNIIADDKKAMEHWNSNLDSLFINEKK